MTFRFPAIAAIAVAALVATPASSQQLDVAVQEVPAQLDPVMIARLVAYRTLPNVFETLIEIDHQNGGVLVPALATDWRRIDDLTLELDLRADVRFHDGTIMTADDVVFSFSETRFGEDQPGARVFGRFLSSIASVEAVDKDTVRVTTHAPDPVLERRLASWGAQVVSREAFEASGGWEAWQVAPVGTGPYRIAAFTPSDVLVLEAFDSYWGDAPGAERITFAVVPEMATRMAGLAAGDYDIVTDVEADQIATVRAYEGVRVTGGPILNHRVVKFDQDNPLMRDPRMRRALSLAIDRELIVETIWQGEVGVGRGLQHPAFGPLYIDEHPQPAYDPDEARRLIQEAGYGGEAIPYRIRNDYYPAQILTAQALVDMWEDVGLNVDLQILENWDQVFAEPGTGMRDGSDPALFGDPVAGIWRNYGGGDDEIAWSNDEFNALGETLLHSLDQAERRQAHKRLLEIFDEVDPPAMVLHEVGQFFGVRDNIEWEPYAAFFMDFGSNNLTIND